MADNESSTPLLHLSPHDVYQQKVLLRQMWGCWVLTLIVWTRRLLRSVRPVVTGHI